MLAAFRDCGGPDLRPASFRRFATPRWGLLPSDEINLGLDLKGGIHLTLGVDLDTALANSITSAGQDLRVEARERKILVLRPRLLGTRHSSSPAQEGAAAGDRRPAGSRFGSFEVSRERKPETARCATYCPLRKTTSNTFKT
jgi:preprotein translocase subunit SecD